MSSLRRPGPSRKRPRDKDEPLTEDASVVVEDHSQIEVHSEVVVLSSSEEEREIIKLFGAPEETPGTTTPALRTIVNEEVNCPICFEPPVNPSMTLCCRTAWCSACLEKCLREKTSCPHCRAVLVDATTGMPMAEKLEGVIREQTDLCRSTVAAPLLDVMFWQMVANRARRGRRSRR